MDPHDQEPTYKELVKAAREKEKEKERERAANPPVAGYEHYDLGTGRMKYLAEDIVSVIKLFNQEKIPAALFNHLALTYHGVNISAAQYELVIPDEKMEEATECLLKKGWVIPKRIYPGQGYVYGEDRYIGGFKEATPYLRFFDYVGDEFQSSGCELILYPASFVNMIGFDQDPEFTHDICHTGYAYIPNGRRLCLTLIQLYLFCEIDSGRDFHMWRSNLRNGVRQCAGVYDWGPQLPENEFDDAPPAIRKVYNDIWASHKIAQRLYIDRSCMPQTPEERMEYINYIKNRDRSKKREKFCILKMRTDVDV